MRKNTVEKNLKNRIRMGILSVIAISAATLLSGCGGCKHENLEKIGFVSATCAEDGYTGDVVCKDCSKVIEKGEVVQAKGHTLSDARYRVEPTCIKEGNTGDIVCTLCGAVVTPGEVIPKSDHVPSEYSYNSYEANCYNEGFTGDIICQYCSTIVTPGEVIPKIEHEPADEVKNAYEPSCWNDGYSGDVVCKYCSTVMEEGEVIPTTGHQFAEPENVVEPTCSLPGYSGDFTCTVCEETERGEEIPATGHKFDDNHTCELCGEMEAGLYYQGEMQMAWEDLVNSSYVSLRNENELTEVNNVLVGDLVISDQVSSINSEVFRGTALTSVTIPAQVTRLRYATFYEAQNLEEIKVLGTLDQIENYAAGQCPKLRSFPFKEGLTQIGEYAFMGSGLTEASVPATVEYIGYRAFKECHALQKVELNSGLTRFYDEVFRDCENLTELTIPDTVERIGNNVFSGTGLTELVFPASVKELRSMSEMPMLKTVDLSATQITSLEDTFENDTALEEIILPDTLTSITENSFTNCTGLTALVFPKGFQNLANGWGGTTLETMTGVTTIVWPESLTNGTDLLQIPNLKLILYTGTDFQWEMVENKDQFQNITVVKNAEYATGEALQAEIVKCADELYEAGDLAAAASIYEMVPNSEGASDKLADEDVKKAVEEAKYAVGKTITLGKFEQDDDLDNGAEDIEWLILDADGDKRLLISVYDLYAMPYSETDPGFFGMTWQNSDVRTWLNTEFVKTAFNAAETAAILDTEVVPDTFANSNAMPGNNTVDKAFCLSIAQVEKYFPDLNSALAKPTEYALDTGAYSNWDYDGACEWWLCAPGNETSNAACMHSFPEIGEESLTEYDNCVRPAMWVDLSALK